jgi:general secretion pathway protein G
MDQNETMGNRQQGTVMMVKTTRQFERGFTLIEIMVVVVIIGLLAAMVAPQVIGRIDQAGINRAKQDIRSIAAALDLYRLDNFVYPTADEGLAVLAGQGGPGQASGKRYINGIPRDPWNNPYLYEIPSRRGGDFDVFTLGADGEVGGEEINADISNWDLN